MEVVSIVSAETVTVAHKTKKPKTKPLSVFFLFVFHINFDVQTVRKSRKQKLSVNQRGKPYCNGGKKRHQYFPAEDKEYNIMFKIKGST